MAKPTRDDWLVKAGLLWDWLAELAPKREIRYYKDGAAAVGLHWRSMRYPLGHIQSYCREQKLPMLPAIVVLKSTRRPGAGSDAHGRSDLDDIFGEVFDFPWPALPNPFSRLRAGDTIESLAGRLLDDPENSGSVYRLVKDRGLIQHVFRVALMEAYDGSCAMCGLSFPHALEGAHIVKWTDATSDEKADVRNGILLCSNHHKLFDASLLTITADYQIQYSDPEAFLGPYSKADHRISTAIHRTLLSLPAEKSVRPARGYINRRNKVPLEAE